MKKLKLKNVLIGMVVFTAFAAVLQFSACKQRIEETNDSLKKIVITIYGDFGTNFIQGISIKSEIGKTWALLKAEAETKIGLKKGYELYSWKLKNFEGEDLKDSYIFNKDTEIFALSVLKGFVRVPVPKQPFTGIDPGKTTLGKEAFWKGVFIRDRVIQFKPYSAAKYEVTYKLWKEVYDWAKTKGFEFENKGIKGGSAPYDEALHSEHEPVTTVNWRDCIVWCNAYTIMKNGNENECVYRESKNNPSVIKNAKDSAVCAAAFADITKTGYRLPTEVEWEYAARWQGEEEINALKYGNVYLTNLDSASGAMKNIKDETTTKEVACYILNSSAKTSTCGSKKANALGLYDMSGNVAEWCWDLFEEISLSTPLDGSNKGMYRCMRGGHWNIGGEDICVGIRGADEHNFVMPGLGFRLFYSLP